MSEEIKNELISLYIHLKSKLAECETMDSPAIADKMLSILDRLASQEPTVEDVLADLIGKVEADLKGDLAEEKAEEAPKKKKGKKK